MGILRDIGLPGIIVILIAALLIFGPQKLPEVGASIGKMITEFKKSLSSDEEKKDEENKK
ncbi:twin-arginine translocase TatA/TatE family subunit [Streptococcus macacae]|uniref:MttA family protein n=1 Tax=Streptococcus macacae NCTC 11558 TaxID=764298 RepID=G5JVH4_9STRE|nr:twin-arginine translocase TatA/TatE family subunit [Streptococcus macacae]EHJ53238.1 MttA family protein [Streptococcus macacae NCTC 11558]SUN78569.1 sec-independent protein secretion pathway component [Streptococcus macacae NCTC 11558]